MSESTAAARMSPIHTTGVAAPRTDSGASARTGSGLNDGPAVVARSRCASWRPHTVHAHAS